MMYEETVEKIARMMARDNDDEQHWGVYATRAMEFMNMTAEAAANDLMKHHPAVIGYLQEYTSKET